MYMSKSKRGKGQGMILFILRSFPVEQQPTTNREERKKNRMGMDKRIGSMKVGKNRRRKREKFEGVLNRNRINGH